MLYNHFKNLGVEILAVNIAESDIAIESFVKKHGLTFPILKDKDRTVTEAYDIVPIPTTLANYMELIKP